MLDRRSRQLPLFIPRHLVPGARPPAWLAAIWITLAAAGCSSSPQPGFKRYAFPKSAFSGDVQRPYTVLGPVRARVDYPSLDAVREEKELCRNYYNKAARDLVRFARKQGGDAVIDVKSVVFLVDGRTELHQDPECSDDGAEGQILAQGIAIKWKGGRVEAGNWVSPLAQLKARELAAKAEKDEKTEKNAKIAAKKSALTWPQSSRAGMPRGMPMAPEGATLVPDYDDADESATVGATPASTHVPVTAQLLAPTPARSRLGEAHLDDPAPEPAALPPVQMTMQDGETPAVAPAPVRRPAAAKPVAKEGEESKPAAPLRALADPRNLPTAVRPKLPIP